MLILPIHTTPQRPRPAPLSKSSLRTLKRSLKPRPNAIACAAHHVAAVAKHPLIAAPADAEGNIEANARHAHQAHRQQLNAVQFTEIAALDHESPHDEYDEVGSHGDDNS